MPETKTPKPKVQRGMVTAVGSREPPRTEVPRVVERAAPPPAPEGETIRYVTNVARFYQVKIVTQRGEDDAALAEKRPGHTVSDDEALTRACLAHETDGYLQFHDYAFATTHRAVAAWLDDRVRRGILRGVGRDSAQMRLGCTHRDADGEPCRYWVFNTPDGLAQLAQHVLDEHDEDDWGREPFLPPPDGEPRSTGDEPEGDNAP